MKLIKIDLLILFSIIVISSSCGLFRHVPKSDFPAAKSNVALIDSFKNHYFDFRTLKIRFEADYISTLQNNSFSGTMQIKKDSLIWISLSPGLGIEVIRLQLTKDTVKFINRLSSEYFVGGYDFIRKQNQIDLTFKTIQAILINNPIIDDSLYLSNVKSTQIAAGNDSLLCSELSGKKDSLTQILSVSNKFYRIVNENLRYDASKSANILYSDFNKIEENQFPNHFEISFPTSSTDVKIIIQYQHIDIDVPLKTGFKIPLKYKELQFK